MAWSGISLDCIPRESRHWAGIEKQGWYIIYLTLSTLGKIFSRRILKYFTYFSHKTGYDISCRRQFTWDVKSCFLGKIRKISSICCLLKMPREWKRLNTKLTMEKKMLLGHMRTVKVQISLHRPGPSLCAYRITVQYHILSSFTVYIYCNKPKYNIFKWMFSYWPCYRS